MGWQIGMLKREDQRRRSLLIQTSLFWRVVSESIYGKGGMADFDGKWCYVAGSFEEAAEENGHVGDLDIFEGWGVPEEIYQCRLAM